MYRILRCISLTKQIKETRNHCLLRLLRRAPLNGSTCCKPVRSFATRASSRALNSWATWLHLQGIEINQAQNRKLKLIVVAFTVRKQIGLDAKAVGPAFSMLWRTKTSERIVVIFQQRFRTFPWSVLPRLLQYYLYRRVHSMFVCGWRLDPHAGRAESWNWHAGRLDNTVNVKFIWSIL